MTDNTNVKGALAEAESLVSFLKVYDESNLVEHRSVLKQLDRIRMALEKPEDVLLRLGEHMATVGALNGLIQLGSFQELPLDGSSVPATELAALSNVDVSVITRMFRVIAVSNITTETAPDEYSHNEISKEFLLDNRGAFLLLAVEFTKMWLELPEYLMAHEPEDLGDIKKSPFAWAAGKEGLTYYEVISLDPIRRHIFNLAMQQMEKNFPIRNMFPFHTMKEQIEKNLERPCLVDIAGGRGHVLLELQKEYPETFKGKKLILQDVPDVLDSVDLDDIPGIEKMGHDIFTIQPVKGAHIYLMSRILHDYHDAICIEILRNIVPAMAADSRLIIRDMLVPERVEVGRESEAYCQDFVLLAMSGRQKTLEVFRQMFETVGLELVKVYPAGISMTVMLETRLKM